MKLYFITAVLALTSLCSWSQSELDSLFYFDYRMNSCAEDEAYRISRKFNLSGSQFQVRTTRANAGYPIKFETIDTYTLVSDDSLIIERSFFKWGERAPGNYRIDVDIVSRIGDTFEINLYSEELNIHTTVFSKTLVPICPIGKTIFYHPNCAISKVYNHDTGKRKLWNSMGEEIEPFSFRDQVDSLPVIANYADYTFDHALKRFIQENLEYPYIARENDITGRIYVLFIVTKTGEIEQVEVMFDGVHPLINNAAMDVFKKLSIERPPFKDGKPVDLKFRHPITFHVQ